MYIEDTPEERTKRFVLFLFGMMPRRTTLMKTMIVYTTRHGCVEKVVELLKKELDDVEIVNLMKQKAPVTLDGYELVILGGSIYFGKIQKELAAFASKATKELLTKRLGLFICAGHPHPDARVVELEQAYPQELLEHAVCKEILGAEINYERLSTLDKLIYRTVSGQKQSYSDLSGEAIRSFVKQLVE
jgi:menaquinone-dependent protoporphyrinogen oxidase